MVATWALAAGRLVLYCDGRAIAPVNGSWGDESLPAGSLSEPRLVIANLDEGGANGLAGELDEVRLYSRVLRADQVARLYQSFLSMGGRGVRSTP